MRRDCWLVPMVLAASACGSVPGSGGGGDDTVLPDATDGNGGSGTNVFAPNITNVVVEIDYETGQEPFTGYVATFGETWEPTVNNVNRLFSNTKAVIIPTTLAQMSNVGTIADEELTIADIAALANMHRDLYDTADTKTYWVLFASGHFADDNGPNTGVLGISIGDTVVMFKDVIRSTGQLANPNTARFVEQSTMVHELAHSIGLVDNGVPMLADHKDDAHGAHCTNPDCVEFWVNEGASAARDFALRRVLTGSTILFDAACLADVDALTGGP